RRDEMAIGAHDSRCSPAGLFGAAASVDATRKTDKAPGDERPHTRWAPERRPRARELALQADELRGRLGPHRKVKYWTPALPGLAARCCFRGAASALGIKLETLAWDGGCCTVSEDSLWRLAWGLT